MDPKQFLSGVFQATPPGSWVAVGVLVAVSCVFAAIRAEYVCGLSAIPALFLVMMAWCGAGLIILFGLSVVVALLVRRGR